MPIRFPKGDLGPRGDFLVKIGPLWHQKSPYQICERKKIPKLMSSRFLYKWFNE